MFLQRVSSIFTEKSVSLVDKYYWRGKSYLDGIDAFLRTPRDVVRLTDALKLTYSAVEGEVNPVDFVALEVLRIFRPSVYEKIRLHPEQFAGSTPSERGDDLTKFTEIGWKPLTKKKKDLLERFCGTFSQNLNPHSGILFIAMNKIGADFCEHVARTSSQSILVWLCPWVTFRERS